MTYYWLTTFYTLNLNESICRIESVTPSRTCTSVRHLRPWKQNVDQRYKRCGNHSFLIRKLNWNLIDLIRSMPFGLFTINWRLFAYKAFWLLTLTSSAESGPPLPAAEVVSAGAPVTRQLLSGVCVCVCVCVYANKQCVVLLSTVEVTVSRGASRLLPTGPKRKRAPRSATPRLVRQPELCKYTLLTHYSHVYITTYITGQESLQTVFFGWC